MKSNLTQLTAVSALLGGFFTLNARADDVATRYMMDREAQSILRRTEAAEARRLPAFVRISRGLTVYSHAGSNDSMARHDEMSTHVLALHTLCRRPVKLVAGHGFAPNLTKITQP